ncbi:MAG: hypothetical protein AW07_00986 [Candidatus Accumulibacter sp. SK-11]|nr:MAG: hypothetical protein AW07_00986 [Candidatus Accumulibacter sp. SK-11]
MPRGLPRRPGTTCSRRAREGQRFALYSGRLTAYNRRFFRAGV